MGQILFLMLLFCALPLHPVQAKTTAGLPLPKAIYGADERTFINASTEKPFKKLSESVALIAHNDVFEKNWLNTRILGNVLSDKTQVYLCADEKFSANHSLRSCTGFLIGPDLVASAGHCFMSADDCANKKIVFEVTEKDETENGYKIPNRRIYECQEIVKSALDDENDFAVIRLKSKVSGRKPLRLKSSKAAPLAKGEKVFMIGHPLGLPQVLSKNANVIETENDHFFKATLDSFEGNSGSPVFNARTFEVEGILVRGEEDFVENSEGQCRRYKTYEEESGKGESITKILDLF